MGYQLVFWQQGSGVNLVAQDVYKALMDEAPVPDLKEFAVETVIEDLAAAFPTAARHGGSEDATVLELDEGGGVLEISWSPQHLLVECRGVPDEAINQVIDVAHAHGCPLYDPQTNERFDTAP